MAEHVHLHNHSHFSLLDGHGLPKEMAEEVARQGGRALALTEHGNMHSAYAHQKACESAGIQPIFGIEAYVAPVTISREDKKRVFYSEGNHDQNQEEGKDVSGGGAYTHMTLLARSNEGLKNLFNITSDSFEKGFYRKPRTDTEFLSQFSNGLIATTGCPSGEIQTRLRLGQFDQAVQYAAKMQDIFGRENYFVELMNHDMGINLEREAIPRLLELSKKLNIPLLATNDSHYTRREDAAKHEHMLCMQTGSNMSERTYDQGGKRFAFSGDGYYLKSAEEMLALFPEDQFPGALSNTVRVAEMSEGVKMEFDPGLRPKIPLPERETASSYLRKITFRGLEDRYGRRLKKEEVDRLEYELRIIEEKGFSDYYLVTQEFINWAKDNGVIVGPARGSGGGSLVAFAIAITELDPLRHGLLFERFLNPERDSPPDFDTDFDDRTRDTVIQHVYETYGNERVASIATYGTLGVKSGLKDSARILNVPYSVGEQLTKKVPDAIMGKEMSFKDLMDPESARYAEAEDFRAIVEELDAQEVIDVARGVEGRLKSTGVHAAGVIISSERLTDHIPLMTRQKDGLTITQWDYPTCEALGLIKMDFLGLRNLTIIGDALEDIERNHGVKLDMNEIIHGDLDDQKTFDLLARGDTVSVFQLDGCLAGNTLVGGRKIADLYESWTAGDRIDTTISIDLGEGKRRRNKVLDIIQSGVKPVFRLVTESGRMVEATADHRFMTSNGWKKLGEVDPAEDQVIVNQRSSTLYYRECLDCDKQISSAAVPADRVSVRCYKCSATFHSNPSKQASREAISKASLASYLNGRVVWNKGLSVETDETMKLVSTKVRKTLAGRNVTKEKLGEEAYQEFIERTRARMTGDKNHMFGRRAPHSKGGYREDLGHYVRSSWEADYARVLIHKGIRYEYEPHTFTVTIADGRTVTYTPDFYLPEENRYVEIKGYMRELDQQKIDAVQEQYGIKLSVIQSSEFAEIQFQFKDLLAWECPSLPAGVDFERVVSIDYVDDQMTYDISMEYPLNNFLANGIMVHNSGMQELMRRVVPTEFKDIAAVSALYRPGPMGMNAHNDYADRKNGRKPVVYPHPSLETALTPILGRTYGVCVYQEQVMKIAQELAGYSLAEADNLRRAMGKKKRDVLEVEFVRFSSGMKERGYEQDAVQAIWDVLMPFADYGFNESHAVGYGLLSYITAFLKANYPAEYMSAVLTSVFTADVEKVQGYLQECRSMGIEVKVPDVNESEWRCAATDSRTLRFGLAGIRGVSQTVSNMIVEARNGEKFVSLNDFLHRIPAAAARKTVLQALVDAGAFDGFGHTRRALGVVVPEAATAANQVKKAASFGQESLFAGLGEDNPDTQEITIPNISEFPKKEMLAKEREVLGLYVSDHPLSGMTEALQGNRSNSIADFTSGRVEPVIGFPPRDGKRQRVAVLVSGVQRRQSKAGKHFAILSIEDESGQMEATLFGSTYEEYADMLEVDKVLVLTGVARVQEVGEHPSFNVDKVSELEVTATGRFPVNFRLTMEQCTSESVEALKHVLRRHPGTSPVRIHLRQPDNTIAVLEVEEGLWVKPSPLLTREVQELFGVNSVGRWR